MWNFKLLRVFNRCQINPFTARACNISGLKDAGTRLQACYIPVKHVIFRSSMLYSGPVTHLLSVLCVLMKILSHASAKRKTKGLTVFHDALRPRRRDDLLGTGWAYSFKFCTFMCCFQMVSWKWRGLKNKKKGGKKKRKKRLWKK